MAISQQPEPAGWRSPIGHSRSSLRIRSLHYLGTASIGWRARFALSVFALALMMARGGPSLALRRGLPHRPHAAGMVEQRKARTSRSTPSTGDSPIVLYCRSGSTSQIMDQALIRHDHTAVCNLGSSTYSVYISSDTRQPGIVGCGGEVGVRRRANILRARLTPAPQAGSPRRARGPSGVLGRPEIVRSAPRLLITPPINAIGGVFQTVPG